MRTKHSLAIGVSTAASLALILAALITDRLPGDIAIAQTVQELPGWLGSIIGYGEQLGSFAVMLPLGLILLAALLIQRRGLEATFVLLLGAWYLVAPLLKEMIERPRPEPGELAVAITKTEFAFPSGHVFGATIVLGAVFLCADVCSGGRRVAALLLRAAAAVLFGIIALSRVYLGVHVPSDVLGGLVIAATGIALLYALYRQRFARFNRLSAA